MFSKTKDKVVGFTRLARWHNDVEQADIDTFKTVSRTIQNHYLNILNYFDNRSTNASAESFNAKIKALRSQFRGARNIRIVIVVILLECGKLGEFSIFQQELHWGEVT
nr:transposase [Arcticibacter tournemirensis]